MRRPRTRRVLFFDDSEARHTAAGQRFTQDDVTHAYTVDEAAGILLREPRFHLASLDHDIDDPGAGYNNDYEPSGDDLVRWMVEKLPRDKWPERIVIHSWNPDGARRMHGRLLEAGHRDAQMRPFAR